MKAVTSVKSLTSDLMGGTGRILGKPAKKFALFDHFYSKIKGEMFALALIATREDPTCMKTDGPVGL